MWVEKSSIKFDPDCNNIRQEQTQGDIKVNLPSSCISLQQRLRPQENTRSTDEWINGPNGSSFIKSAAIYFTITTHSLDNKSKNNKDHILLRRKLKQKTHKSGTEILRSIPDLELYSQRDT